MSANRMDLVRDDTRMALTEDDEAVGEKRGAGGIADAWEETQEVSKPAAGIARLQAILHNKGVTNQQDQVKPAHQTLLRPPEVENSQVAVEKVNDRADMVMLSAPPSHRSNHSASSRRTAFSGYGGAPSGALSNASQVRSRRGSLAMSEASDQAGGGPSKKRFSNNGPVMFGKNRKSNKMDHVATALAVANAFTSSGAQKQMKRALSSNKIAQQPQLATVQSFNVVNPEDSAEGKKVGMSELPWWQRVLCFCFFGWDIEADQYPQIPHRNAFGKTPYDPSRRRLLHLTASPWYNNFMLLLACADSALLVIEAEGEISGVVEYSTIVFSGLYTIDIGFRFYAWGVSGGKMAFMRQNTYNKIDLIVTVICWVEIILGRVAFFGFTIRSIKLLRLLQPLTRFITFAGVEAVLKTVEVGFLALGTVVYLMLFFFVVFGVVGMEAYSGSFNRRCVWADSYPNWEVKQPEQWCKRFDKRKFELGRFPSEVDNGLNNNCGPFQLCVDVGAPNNGFTNFDNMATSMLSIFQSFTADSQYVVMWASLQSEPDYTGITIMYYLFVAFLLGQLLINVFLAVLTTVFTAVRVSMGIMSDEAEEAAQKEVDDAIKGAVNAEHSRESLNRRGSLASQVSVGKLDGADDVSSETSVSSIDEITKGEPGLARDRDELDVAGAFRFIFRSAQFEVFVLLVIFGNSAIIALSGHVDQETAALLVELERYFSIFFLLEFLCQIVSDGSLQKYFAHAEHSFDLLVQLFTTSALLAESIGASTEDTTVLRSLAILRLIRGCKYYFMRPLWLMLIKAVESVNQLGNLIIVIFVTMFIFTIMGMVLFGERLQDPRANFTTMSRGMLTLFQVFTGDSWSSVMYSGMSVSCDDETGDCASGAAFTYAAFYIVFLWLGQFIFITLFLGLILENFSVDEFMHMDRQFDEDDPSRYIDVGEARIEMGKYQMIPPEAINEEVLLAAFEKLHSQWTGGKVMKKSLITYLRKHAPMRYWKISKALGLIFMRYIFRKYVCCLFSFAGELQPHPGDPDWIPPPTEVDDEHIPTVEELIEVYISKNREDMRIFMGKLEKQGLVGEVRMIARDLGIAQKNIPFSLRETDPHIVLKLIQNETIANRLGIDTSIIAQKLTPPEPGEKKLTVAETIQREVDWVKTLDVQEIMAQRKKLGIGKKQDDAGVVQQEGEDKADLMSKFDKEGDHDIPEDFLGKLWWDVKKVMLMIAVSPLFDTVVYLSIIVSSILLAFEMPAPEIPGPLPYDALVFAGYVFNAIFMVECLSKIGAYGFLLPNFEDYPAYLRSNWNKLDFFVVSVSILELSGAGAFLGSNILRVIRTMRALRPLRLMSRNKGMKTIVYALLGSTKPITYAIMFLFVITTVFGVLGVALFRDTFQYCVDGDWVDGTKGEGKLECHGEYYADLFEDGGFPRPRSWLNTPWNFDTFGSAVITLSRVFTLKWTNVWYNAQDRTSPGVQPVENNNVAVASAFLISFIFMGSFLSLNLFVSFIVDGFYSAQGADTKFDDIQYATTQKMIISGWPDFKKEPPTNLVSLMTRRVTSSEQFQVVSATLLMMNIIMMTMSHEGQDGYFSYFLSIQNDVFFGIMCFETILQFIGWGPMLFVFDPANWFDMFLITSTAIIMLVGEELRKAAQVIRVLRLAKFLRALQKNKLIKSVFDTVVLSGPQVINIVVVLFIAMTIFAVLGVSSFGAVSYGSRLGPQANFFNYPMAMMTLFQIMFGDEWMFLMDDCSIAPPFCTETFPDPHDPTKLLSYGDCGSAFAPVYFISFILLCTCTMLNLFVGMVINNFSFCSNKDAQSELKEVHLKKFREMWVDKFDKAGTAFVSVSCLYQFMWRCPFPLGYHDEEESSPFRFLKARNELLRIVAQEESRLNAFAGAVREAGNGRDGPVMRMVDKLRFKEMTLIKEAQDAYTMAQEARLEWEGKGDLVLEMRKAKEVYLQNMTSENARVSDDRGVIGDLKAMKVWEWDPQPEMDEKVYGRKVGRLTRIAKFGLEAVLEMEEQAKAAGEFEEISESEPDGEELDYHSSSSVSGSRSGSFSRSGSEAGGDDATKSIAVTSQYFGTRHEPVHVSRSRSVHVSGSRSVHVSGSSMGQKGKGGKPKVKAKKVVKEDMAKKSKRAMKNVETDIDDDGNITYMTKARAAQVAAERAGRLNQGPPPKVGKGPIVTNTERMYRVARFLLSLLLAKQDRCVRPKGLIRFDEMVNALMYWNPNGDPIPKKISEKREEFDIDVVEVAGAQLIQGVYRGVTVRHLMKQLHTHRFHQVQDRARRYKELLMEEFGENGLKMGDEQIKRVKSSEELDLEAQGFTEAEALERLRLEQEEAERAAAEEFALRADFDRMISKNLMGDGGETERFILRCHQELGYDPTVDGYVPSIPFEELRAVRDHPDLERYWARLKHSPDHARALLVIDRLLEAGLEKTLLRIAEDHDVDYYSVESIAHITKPDALRLVRDDAVRKAYAKNFGHLEQVMFPEGELPPGGSSDGHSTRMTPLGEWGSPGGSPGTVSPYQGEHDRVARELVDRLQAEKDELAAVLEEAHSRLQKEKEINFKTESIMARERERMQLEVQAERKRIRDEKARVDAMMDDVERRERIMSSPQYALGMTVPEVVSGGSGAGPMARRPATAGGERPGLQRGASMRPATASAGGQTAPFERGMSLSGGMTATAPLERGMSSSGGMTGGMRPSTAGPERPVLQRQNSRPVTAGVTRPQLDRQNSGKYDATEALGSLTGRPDSAFSTDVISEHSAWSESDAEEGMTSLPGSTIRAEDASSHGSSRPMSASHASSHMEASSANSGHSVGVAYALDSLRKRSNSLSLKRSGSEMLLAGSSTYIQEDVEESDGETTTRHPEGQDHPMTESPSEPMSERPATANGRSSPVKPTPVKILQDPEAIQAEIEARQQEVKRLQRSLVQAKHDKEEQGKTVDPAEQIAKMMRSEELRLQRLQTFKPISTTKALGLDDSVSSKQRKRPPKKTGGPSWL